METEPSSKQTENSIALPNDFAEHVATLSDLETAPATLEEWWTAVFEQFAETGHTVTLADLYRDRPTRHEVHVDGRIRYAGCAADALMAAVLEDQGTVTVRSIDPVAATPVTITVRENATETSPEGALVCFGSSVDREDVEALGSLADWVMQDDTSVVEAGICQHTNAFESRATYEQWAAATGTESDRVTAPIPPAGMVRVMRRLVQDRE